MDRRIAVRVLGVAMLAASLVRTANAQQVPDPDAPSVASASGARLTIGGFLQADGRLVAGDDASSGPLLRRARLVFDATGDNGFRLR